MDYRVTHDLIDLRQLNWMEWDGTSGPGGSCLKAEATLSSGKVYYKLSRYEERNGIVGHESVNEIIVDRLLQKLCIPHLPYQLLHAQVKIGGKEYETYLCASENYRGKGESKCSLDQYYNLLHSPDETPLEFCIRMGWEKEACQMILTDYLIANRDRNGGGIEVIKSQGSRAVRLAPIHDHGNSLLFQCREDAVAAEQDVMREITMRSFFGGRSPMQNLELIPKDIDLGLQPLREEDREDIFYNLDPVMSKVFQDKIWEMIWKRWKHYETVCHS